MRRRNHELEPRAQELYVRYFLCAVEGKLRVASRTRIALRRLLLKSCNVDKNASSAIALGDISVHTKTRYQYYCMAVKYDARNVEAISHAALEAARLGLDKAAQSLVHRALKVGFSKYRVIKDVLLHDLFIAAALVGNNRSMSQVKVLLINTDQYRVEIQQEHRWRNEWLRRKR